MSFWKMLFKGGGDQFSPNRSSKLNLESLDGRIVPDATPVSAPVAPVAQVNQSTPVDPLQRLDELRQLLAQNSTQFLQLMNEKAGLVATRYADELQLIAVKRELADSATNGSSQELIDALKAQIKTLEKNIVDSNNRINWIQCEIAANRYARDVYIEEYKAIWRSLYASEPILPTPTSSNG